ncbi:MAG: hypothetical protein BIFFINMI_02309 [Phycisphaerae bacterium]|nr:hypothetical protein [Phycisphaerae bacterium]
MISLAAGFGLLMVLVAFGFWLLLGNDGAGGGRPDSFWIRTQPAGATVGQTVGLSARVIDDAGKPVAGYALQFRWEGEAIGSEATDGDGWARVRFAFPRPGEQIVDVIPDPAERRAFRVPQNGVIRVTVVK